MSDINTELDDDLDDDDLPGEGDQQVTLSKRDVDALRAAAKRKGNDGETDTLARENAILKALPGADLTTPVGSGFLRGYQGDLSVEAIRAEAQAWNVWAPAGEPPPEPEPSVVIDEDERQQTDLRRSVATGAAPSTDGTPPPKTAAVRSLEHAQEVLDSGAPKEDALGVFVRERVQGAMAGDQSVLLERHE